MKQVDTSVVGACSGTFCACGPAEHPPCPSAFLAFPCRCAAIDDMTVLIAVGTQRGMPLPWDAKSWIGLATFEGRGRSSARVGVTKLNRLGVFRCCTWFAHRNKGQWRRLVLLRLCCNSDDDGGDALCGCAAAAWRAMLSGRCIDRGSWRDSCSSGSALR